MRILRCLSAKHFSWHKSVDSLIRLAPRTDGKGWKVRRYLCLVASLHSKSTLAGSHPQGVSCLMSTCFWNAPISSNFSLGHEL